MFCINQTHEERMPQQMAGDDMVVRFSGRKVLMCTAGGVGRLPKWSEISDIVSETVALVRVGEMDGTACWGMTGIIDENALPSGVTAMECRAAFLQPTMDVMNAISRARMFVQWRNQHRLCGGCGEPLFFSESDLALICPKCGTRYYPQLAPAVIVAILRNGGREILLAHNRKFTTPTFGLIAGFVEAGETVEQAVSREIREETGINVKNIRYKYSQPWPFPCSLMLGFTAEYDSGDACADGNELTELGWFSRENLPPIPAPGSIARQLIDELMGL